MIVVLVGPTAVGKSALAVALAQRFAADGQPAEIVNADSMLVYRGMDIGTAKPSLEERGGVPHHLIDILDVTQTATVADFQTLARSAIGDCQARGVVPILAGGSALYVRAIVDDFTFPGTDPRVRGALEAELAEVGPEVLHARLAGLDPGSAAMIEPENGRRIVRALEVISLTGQPYDAGLPDFTYWLPGVVQLGLDADRGVVDARIALRVEQMWRAGLVEEVRALTEIGLREGVTASRALGYRQVLQFLDGEITETQAQELTLSGTRRFARRQGGWYRRDPRINWVAAMADDVVDRAYSAVRESAAGHREVKD